MAGEEKHFQHWLRRQMSGCFFAGQLAGTTMAIETYLPPLDPTLLDSSFDKHGASERVVVGLLPSIRSDVELVEALNSLPSGRWKIVRRHPDHEQCVFVGVEWKTASGDLCHAMGFAPFITMPVPRRAPYVALGLWPGGRLNPFRGQKPTPPSKDGVVDFLDAAHGLDDASYRKRWEQTTNAVNAILPNSKPYRDSAFVLPVSLADRIKFT